MGHAEAAALFVRDDARAHWHDRAGWWVRERRVPPFNKVRALLERLVGIELVELARPDECCGFGGTFAVAEEAVSCMMGRDRVADHERAGAEIITAVDMSCLMHMDGLLRRDRKPLKVMHVAELLDQAEAAA